MSSCIRGITFRGSDIIHIMGGGAFTIHKGARAKIEDLLNSKFSMDGDHESPRTADPGHASSSRTPSRI